MQAPAISRVIWVLWPSCFWRVMVRKSASRMVSCTAVQYSPYFRSRQATLSERIEIWVCASSQRVRFFGNVVPLPTDFTGSRSPKGRTGLFSRPLA